MQCGFCFIVACFSRSAQDQIHSFHDWSHAGDDTDTGTRVKKSNHSYIFRYDAMWAAQQGKFQNGMFLHAFLLRVNQHHYVWSRLDLCNVSVSYWKQLSFIAWLDITWFELSCHLIFLTDSVPLISYHLIVVCKSKFFC